MGSTFYKETAIHRILNGCPANRASFFEGLLPHASFFQMKHKTLISPDSTIQDASAGWVELTDRKEEFQKILRLLTDFTERIGSKDQALEEGHYCRKAISVVPNPETNLQVFLRGTGVSVYLVLALLKNHHGLVVSAWFHEDGIFQEREKYRDNSDHPVHNIVCMTDLATHSSMPVQGNIHSLLKVDCESLFSWAREFLE